MIQRPKFDKMRHTIFYHHPTRYIYIVRSTLDLDKIFVTLVSIQSKDHISYDDKTRVPILTIIMLFLS